MSDPNHLPTASIHCSTSLHLGGEMESSPSLPLSLKASASFYLSNLDSLAFMEFFSGFSSKPGDLRHALLTRV